MHMSSKYSFLRVISGPFLDYVGTMFVLIFYPDKIGPQNLKHWFNIVLSNLYFECLLFWTMPGPSLDHAGSLFGLFLVPDQM